MQSDIKTVLLTISLATVVIALVLGSTSPVFAQTNSTTNNLVKRDYSYANDQHLTARFGNDKVCGDHLCAPGEWTKLQENLNQAQIVHSPNSTQTLPVSPNVPMTNSTNATSQMQSTPVPPTPAPIPTPQVEPSAICVAVKTVLENSNVPSTTVTRIMADLGCTS